VDCRDEPQHRSLIWEQGGDTGTAFDFLVESFDPVVGSQPLAVCGREGEDGQGLGGVLLESAGKCGCGLVVTADHVLESPIGLGTVFGVVDPPDVIGDIAPHRHLGNRSHGVLARVKLAPLPRYAWHGGMTGRLEPCVVVADDELHAVEASFLEALKELPPVSFGLTPSDAAAEYRALAVGGHRRFLFGVVRHFQENLDDPPFQPGGR